jgi:hypothetical protein
MVNICCLSADSATKGQRSLIMSGYSASQPRRLHDLQFYWRRAVESLWLAWTSCANSLWSVPISKRMLAELVLAALCAASHPGGLTGELAGRLVYHHRVCTVPSACVTIAG